MSDIQVQSLSKQYEGKPVLENLSSTFPEGTTTCIMGPSGTGKTTFLRLIAGLERPDNGTILGVPERIAFVFQEDRLAKDFKAEANIRLVTGSHIPSKEIQSHLIEIGLGDSLDKPVHEFSGGMKRRVAIVRAILYQADLLLLDEPFKGLDDALKQTVIAYIKKHAQGKTILCVTHDKTDAELLGANLFLLGETN